jgi:hypothetical protein
VREAGAVVSITRVGTMLQFCLRVRLMRIKSRNSMSRRLACGFHSYRSWRWVVVPDIYGVDGVWHGMLRLVFAHVLPLTLVIAAAALCADCEALEGHHQGIQGTPSKEDGSGALKLQRDVAQILPTNSGCSCSRVHLPLIASLQHAQPCCVAVNMSAAPAASQNCCFVQICWWACFRCFRCGQDWLAAVNGCCCRL